MNVYKLKTASAEQALIIDKLKNAGADVIQVSDGLIVKADKSSQDLKSALGEEGAQVSIDPIDPTDETLSKDARAFAGLT